jgi:hypothetical protein
MGFLFLGVLRGLQEEQNNMMHYYGGVHFGEVCEVAFELISLLPLHGKYLLFSNT